MRCTRYTTLCCSSRGFCVEPRTVRCFVRMNVLSAIVCTPCTYTDYCSYLTITEQDSVTVAKSAFEWQMFSRCSFSPTVPCIGIDSAKRKKGRDMGQGLTKHEASTPCTQRRTRKRAHRNVSSQNNPETSANQWWGMQRSWHSLWVYHGTLCSTQLAGERELRRP